MTISSGTDYAGGSLSRTGLAARTPYYVEVRAVPQGRPLQVLARRCFMTGGTYTITNLSINNGSNGCFSISPLTIHHVRNCLCGRGATGSVTIDGSAVSWDYSSIRSNWGCR
ncbi:MAG: hypothetical protein OXC57_09725 [Rhodobacteraceae bacterium]|nr:hypothetical protein [Paracoccaceae bacterium]